MATCPNCESESFSRVPFRFRSAGNHLYLDDEVTVATHLCDDCKEPIAMETEH